MIDEIEAALIARAKTTAQSYSLVPDLPNVDPGAGTSRIRFQFPDADHDDPTVKGGGRVQINGTMIITIIMDANVGTGTAHAAAAALAALYPKGLSLTVASGRVVIRQTPQVSFGYPDEDSWIVPIRVLYLGITA